MRKVAFMGRCIEELLSQHDQWILETVVPKKQLPPSLAAYHWVVPSVYQEWMKNWIKTSYTHSWSIDKHSALCKMRNLKSWCTMSVRNAENRISFVEICLAVLVYIWKDIALNPSGLHLVILTLKSFRSFKPPLRKIYSWILQLPDVMDQTLCTWKWPALGRRDVTRV